MLAPFANTGESPYAVHRDLQTVMQSLVGIYRTAEDLERALTELQMLKARAAVASVEGSRMFNPGWHFRSDLKSMLTDFGSGDEERAWHGRKAAARIAG